VGEGEGDLRLGEGVAGGRSNRRGGLEGEDEGVLGDMLHVVAEICKWATFRGKCEVGDGCPRGRGC